jgi:hypothetical protein
MTLVVGFKLLQYDQVLHALGRHDRHTHLPSEKRSCALKVDGLEHFGRSGSEDDTNSEAPPRAPSTPVASEEPVSLPRPVRPSAACTHESPSILRLIMNLQVSFD